MRLAFLALVVFLFSYASGQNAPVYQMSDGGTRQTLESIFVPPVLNEPFSLTLDTEWTRPLTGGGTYTLVNRRHIKRDNAGRIYEERWLLVPKDGKVKSTMNWIQIADPATHILLNCQVANKFCRQLAYTGSTSARYAPRIATSGPLPNGEGSVRHEDLGAGATLGVATVGYRDTTTINPGVFGNDAPMVTTREFWYAQTLGINLVSIVDSPQSGKQAFTVVELTTEEPDPHFFSIPEGYRVGDARQPVGEAQQ